MRHRCTTLPLYHFTIWKCITLPLYIDKVYLASGVKHWRTVYCLSKPLIAPYSHEKRLYGSLYHKQRKSLKTPLNVLQDYDHFIGLKTYFI